MNYEFTKLSEVESLSEVPENATVLAEVDGKIKRIPGSGLGGGGAIKTAIIKHAEYDEAVAYLVSGNSEKAASATTESSTDSGFYCTNMTFDEAYETMVAGEPLDIILMILQGDYPGVAHGWVCFTGILGFGVPTIMAGDIDGNWTLFWTADGILTSPPGSSNEN